MHGGRLFRFRSRRWAFRFFTLVFGGLTPEARARVDAIAKKREDDGKWKDAGSLRPADLPSLVLALSAAHEYVDKTPLPGEAIDGEEVPMELEEVVQA